MDGEAPPWNVEFAVAIGRVEEGVKGMNASLLTMADSQRVHSTTLNRHEVDIQVLKSKQQPRIHWLTIIVGIVAIAGFTLAVLDRLYTEGTP